MALSDEDLLALEHWLQRTDILTDRKPFRVDRDIKEPEYHSVMHYVDHRFGGFNVRIREMLPIPMSLRFSKATDIYGDRKRGKRFTFGVVKEYAKGWGYELRR